MAIEGLAWRNGLAVAGHTQGVMAGHARRVMAGLVPVTHDLFWVTCGKSSVAGPSLALRLGGVRPAMTPVLRAAVTPMPFLTATPVLDALATAEIHP